MPKHQSFSRAVDNLLLMIHPHGRLATTSYPSGLRGADIRRGKKETPQSWFKRMMDQFCDGKPERCALERHFGIFAQFYWQEGNRLIGANIQVVCARPGLVLDDLYYLGDEAEAIYLRLDLDYESLGDPFSHPLPHIHVEGTPTTRFALEGGRSGNVIMDFLEFLYRNYAYNEWLNWVKREWEEEFKPFAQMDIPDPLPRILEIFKDPKFENRRIESLRHYEADIEKIKTMLRRRKDELFDPRMNGSDRVILEYPLAR